MLDPDEVISAYKLTLPEDFNLVEPLWHNMLVYIDKT
jgi:hypothetical protein